MATDDLEPRVAVLEALQEEIKTDVHEMKVNHLPHIERKVDSLRNWIMGAMFSVVLALVGIVANLFVQFLLHG
jgi:hypothetical protein